MLIETSNPTTIQTESKFCEFCGKEYNRKRFASKLEDIRHYKNRRYCSRLCADESVKLRAKNHYEANKELIRAKKRDGIRRLRSLDPAKYNALSRASKARERALLFSMYGHVCAMCGFEDKRALTLDHIQNNGNQERRDLGERGVYRKAKTEHQPDQYQILCMNCQFIKRAEHCKQQQPGDCLVGSKSA